MSCCVNRKTWRGCGRGGGCHSDPRGRVWTPAHGARTARPPPSGPLGRLRPGDPLGWRSKGQESQGAVAAVNTLERKGWAALARAASFRVPPPRAAPESQEPTGFHGNQKNLAWAAWEIPGEGPAAGARAPRRLLARPPRPRARATAEQPTPLPPLLAHPALTSSPARRYRLRRSTRLPRLPLA